MPKINRKKVQIENFEPVYIENKVINFFADIFMLGNQVSSITTHKNNLNLFVNILMLGNQVNITIHKIQF